MNHLYDKIEAFVEKEKRELAKFEVYCQWFAFVVLVGCMICLAVLEVIHD